MVVATQAVDKDQPHLGLLYRCREDIKCVFERDPAARNALEVMFTYPGIQALFLHRFSHALWQRGWRGLPRLIAFLGRFFTNIDIHPGAQVGRRLFIDHGACVVIGETAIIGDDVTLYHGVTLGGTSWNKGRRHPELGDNVLVGAGAKILGAIHVGSNSRVGANSVVVEDVPESCTVVGIPGKIVMTRDQSSANKYGIDLDHHLIPDPVGKAIACLLTRLDGLEERLHMMGKVDADYQEMRYQFCEVDNQICEQDCAGGSEEADIARKTHASKANCDESAIRIERMRTRSL